jgi:hypothetical protein
LVVLLLGLDIVVGWMVIQGAYVYLGMVWHGAAGESLAPGAIEEHGRQFLVLRWIQIGVWTATAAAFLAWRHRARQRARALGDSEAARVRWGPVAALLILAAAAAHALAAGLAADPLRPLDLGGPMQLLMLAQILEIAAAGLGILLVRRLTDRLDARHRALP